MKWRRPATVLALSVIAVAALFAVGEVGARFLLPPFSPCWIPHPLLGRVHPPLWTGPRVSLEDGSVFTFTTNALGLRGRSIEAAKKAPNTYRIFFVGASSTENVNLPEEKTFPGVVERLLNERTHGTPRVEVGNAGLAGADSSESLAQIAHRLLFLEPNMIVALEGTDFLDSLGDDWDPTTYAVARWRPVGFSEWLLSRSRLASFVEERFASGVEIDARPLLKRRALDRRRKPILDPPEDVLFRGLARFKANLRHMALLCKAEKVQLALMTNPCLYKAQQPPEEDAVLWLSNPPRRCRWNLTTATARRGIDVYNDAVRSVAAEEGALLIDLDRAVHHDLENLVDDVHMTAKGNDAAGHAIFEAIARAAFGHE